jgi:hypothetical protein
VFVLHEHGARVHVNDADGVPAEMWETGLYWYRFVVSVTGILEIICVQYYRKTLSRIRVRLKLIILLGSTLL